MSPPWATDEQTKFLNGWMGDFISWQGDGKLHLFLVPMFEAWFSRWPKHAGLGLPLPSDRTAFALTQEELVVLGAAIVSRQGVSIRVQFDGLGADANWQRLENWFQYRRKKIRNANTPAASATTVVLRSMFKELVPKCRCMHQAIKIFQKRNPEPIHMALDEAGYNMVSADGDRLSRSERMRIRKRVANALWAEADTAEVKAVKAEVEEEKREIREEDEALEASIPKKQMPRDLQNGIDILDQVYTDVHKATYNAAGWVGMSIMGGPNPRMGGELSMKIQERAERALPARPAAADGPRVDRDMGVLEPAPKTKTTKTKSKKKKVAKAAAMAGAAQRIAVDSPQPDLTQLTPDGLVDVPSPAVAAQAPVPSFSAEDPSFAIAFDDNLHLGRGFDNSSLPNDSTDDEDPFGMDAALTQLLPTPPPTFNPWPTGMPPLPSPATAIAIALVERGIPSDATMAIDPRLTRGAPWTSPPTVSSPTLQMTRPKPRPSYQGASHASSGGLDAAVPLAMTNVVGFHFPAVSTPSSTGTFDRPSTLFQVFGRSVPAAAAPSLFPLPVMPKRSHGPLPAPGFASRSAQALASIIGASPHVFTGHAPPPPPPPPLAPFVANGGVTSTATDNMDAMPTVPMLKPAVSLPGSRSHIKPPGVGKKEVSGDAKKKQAAVAVKKKEVVAMKKREMDEVAGRKREEVAAAVLKEVEVAWREAEAEAESDAGGRAGVPLPVSVIADAPLLTDASNARHPARARKATRFIDGSEVALPVKGMCGVKKTDTAPEAALMGAKRKRVDENVGENAKSCSTGLQHSQHFYVCIFVIVDCYSELRKRTLLNAAPSALRCGITAITGSRAAQRRWVNQGVLDLWIVDSDVR
ncbi:hypothetical protein FB451DRAFT_1450164 [Mycena latifolia]|nr:hypothetical protein FB451DRAFT_1450164 [Mycena latifolia]